MSLRIKGKRNPARVAGIRPELVLAAIIIHEIFRERGVECTITSCVEGKHNPGSKHFPGLALDFRTIQAGLDKDQTREIAAECRRRMGLDFDVVAESDHLHVEFDSKHPVNMEE